MVLSLPRPGTSELPLLVDFIPADPTRLDPNPPISQEEAWDNYQRCESEHYKKLPTVKAPTARKMMSK
jgi:hypothetical protein